MTAKEKYYVLLSDYDDMLEKDCAIKGDAYTQIINVCFRYAVMFSLTTTKKHPAMVSEAPPPIFSQPHYNKGVSGGFRDTVYFFSCSEQAKTFLYLLRMIFFHG